MRIGICCYPTAGGSGVVAMPITYIFDEEPERIKAMLEALGQKGK